MAARALTALLWSSLSTSKSELRKAAGKRFRRCFFNTVQHFACIVLFLILCHILYMEKLNRITQQAGVMGGKACIRSMRVTVGMIVAQIGAGRSTAQLLDDYPYLEQEDIQQALRYAAWLADERETLLASA
jgi:uncharacterized protein (DUF433 family)